MGEKYPEFLQTFPTVRSLAGAPVADVLTQWQGLGYNRRALFLKRAAEKIVFDYGGKVPANGEDLMSLPGVGQSTAGAVLAFGFNKPSVFIETNIRRTIIHFFFAGEREISDTEVRELVKRILPRENFREWYWALMDYGAKLAEEEKENPNRRSKHHAVQPRFEGSRRQIRGIILRELAKGNSSQKNLSNCTGRKGRQLRDILADLTKEGFIEKQGSMYGLKR